MSECRYRRLPVWWRPCEAALRNLDKTKKRIRIIEEVYAQPGKDLSAIRVQGGENHGFASMLDRKDADRYLNRLKLEVMAIHATDQIMALAYGMDGARDRCKVVEMLYTKATHQIIGVANELHVTRRTAERYRAQYLWCLARQMGYEPMYDEEKMSQTANETDVE